jgi:hypothetical protein
MTRFNPQDITILCFDQGIQNSPTEATLYMAVLDSDPNFGASIKGNRLPARRNFAEGTERSTI